MRLRRVCVGLFEEDALAFNRLIGYFSSGLSAVRAFSGACALQPFFPSESEVVPGKVVTAESSVTRRWGATRNCASYNDRSVDTLNRRDDEKDISV